MIIKLLKGLFSAYKLNRLWAKSRKDKKMKNFLTSKTIWGLLIMAVPWIAKNILGIDVTETEAESAVESIVKVAGFALAVYGRFRADKKLTLN